MRHRPTPFAQVKRQTSRGVSCRSLLAALPEPFHRKILGGAAQSLRLSTLPSIATSLIKYSPMPLIGWLLQAEKTAKTVIDLGCERWCDPPVSVPESARICEPDPGQVDSAAASEVTGQWQQYAGYIAVRPAVDQHDDRIVTGVGIRADDQDADASATEGVVDDVAARWGAGLGYHAALKSANTAASSPVREACHAAAAATARRSRYSRMASATSADRLLPATAALSSSPRSSSRVMEILTVTSVTLPSTVLSARSPNSSACRYDKAKGRAVSTAQMRDLVRRVYSTP